jgi:dolichol-phosphate mannosyltransferase
MLSIIVPTYCEAENIKPLVRRIRAALEPAVDYEIVFVDDNSLDGTVERIAEACRGGAPARLVVRKNERGLSGAVLRGFREARGDLLLCMDADMSHPPEAIPEMLRAQAQQQADIVVGSRYVAGGGVDKGWGLYRWMNSLVALWLARPLTPVRDAGAGFFLLPRRVFEAGRELNPIGYKMLTELLVKCPCRNVVEVPIQFADRKFGESKLDFRQQVLYLLHLKRLYDYKFGRASRFVQFCAIGASGVVVNLLMFATLQKFGVPQKVAYALAIWAAMTWNFVPNRYLTFDLVAHHPALPQYFRFVLTCLVGALVNWSVTVGLAQELPWFGAHVYCAALIGIICGMSFNFIISHVWAFRLGPVEK